MRVYSLTMLSIVLFRGMQFLLPKVVILKNNIDANKKRDFIFLCFAGSLLILVPGMRGYSVGTDTEGYIKMFNEVLTYGSSYGEVGYNIFSKIISCFSDSPRAILLATATFTGIGIIRFIWKYSGDVFLSTYLYITLYYWFFTFNGVRQFMAIVIILNSINYLYEKKIYRYLFMMLIAMSFHTSACIGIVFIFIYYMNCFRFSTKMIIIGILFSFIFLLFDSFIMLAFKVLPIYSRYSERKFFTQSSGIMYIILYLSIFLFCYAGKNMKTNVEKRDFNNIIVVLFLCLWFSILGLKSNSFNRLGWYFYIFTIIAIPNAIKLGKFYGRSKTIVYLVVFFVSIMYLYYEFFNNWHSVIPYNTIL